MRCGAGRPASARWWSGARTTIWAWGTTRWCWTGRPRRCARYGAGAGGTRNIAGTTRLHVQLEAELARLHGKPAALLFTSGYVANEAAIGTIARLLPGCLILSDADEPRLDDRRASGPPAARSRSSATTISASSSSCWRPSREARPKLVAFEGVYSMDGDFGPVRAVCALARRHGALTYLDEVHAVGMYGATGAGVAERDGVMAAVDVVQGTLGKAFGCMGGYIAGGAALVDAVRSHAPGFIFTTSLPPAVVGGALAAVRFLAGAGGVRLARGAAGAGGDAEAAAAGGRPAGDGQPVAHRAAAGRRSRCAARPPRDLLLARHGIYLQPINYPTVPRGTERLRITPGPAHDDALHGPAGRGAAGRLARARHPRRRERAATVVQRGRPWQGRRSRSTRGWPWARPMRPRCPARNPDLVAAQPPGQGLDRLQAAARPAIRPPARRIAGRGRRVGSGRGRQDERQEEHGQQHPVRVVAS